MFAFTASFPSPPSPSKGGTWDTGSTSVSEASDRSTTQLII